MVIRSTGPSGTHLIDKFVARVAPTMLAVFVTVFGDRETEMTLGASHAPEPVMS